MKFLKRLRQFFANTSPKPEPQIPQQVSRDERISRYIFEKTHFSKENKIVKASAFIPPKNGEESVYRTSTCSEDEIWQIGKEYVTRKKPIKARGDLLADVVMNEGLKFDANGQPHFRHANIVGWEESSQRMKAVILAKNSTLHISPHIQEE